MNQVNNKLGDTLHWFKILKRAVIEHNKNEKLTN